jgi:hypothetical protein
MIRSIRSRLTFANVTSLVALFVALGGSSYAALNLPKGSVGSKQLRKNAVTSPKVKPGALLLSDFRRSQRSMLRGPAGAQGPAGPQGVPGPSGPQGERGEQGLPATRLFAHVAGAGTLGYGSGVTAVSRPATGVFDVTFNRSLEGCSAVADSGLGIGVSGSSSFLSQVRPFIGAFAPDNNTVHVVIDRIQLSGGVLTAVPQNDNFHLAVFC